MIETELLSRFLSVVAIFIAGMIAGSWWDGRNRKGE